MENDVICTGADECSKLRNVTNTIYYGNKEIVQRPEYCSGIRPHRPMREEDMGHRCPFINKWVRSKRVWVRSKRVKEG